MRVIFSIIVIIMMWAMFGCIGLLGLRVGALEEQLKQKDVELTNINKTSYERFIIAKDLTDICNRFKSSREAKEKYFRSK